MINLLLRPHSKDELKKFIFTTFDIKPDGSNLEPWMKHLMSDKPNIKFVEKNVGVIINDEYEYSPDYYMYNDFRIPNSFTVKNNSLYCGTDLIVVPVFFITNILYISGGRYPTFYRFKSSNGEFSARSCDVGIKGKALKKFKEYVQLFVYYNTLKPKKIKILEF